MRNINRLTVYERLTKDLDFAETVTDQKHRELLTHMAIASAELAIDFNLITYKEWGSLTRRAFTLM